MVTMVLAGLPAPIVAPPRAMLDRALRQTARKALAVKVRIKVAGLLTAAPEAMVLADPSSAKLVSRSMVLPTVPRKRDPARAGTLGTATAETKATKV